MRLSINYPNGGGFELDGADEEEVMWLYNISQKTLWGRNAKAMTLEETDAWLGWTR